VIRGSGPLSRAAVAVAWLFALLLGATRPATAQAPSMADSVATTEPAKWPYTLPFVSDMALKRGYELPLPLGLSGVFYCVDGAPLRSVSKFLNAGSTSHVSVAVARFDACSSPSSTCI
jgi:hypothetical protein